MAKELNEDTGFNVSIKSLVGIGAAMATVISMWFVLQADIDEAKKLPEPLPPDVTRMEFDMKDQLIRQTIMTTQKDVEELKDDMGRIEEKLDKLIEKRR
jgi:ribosomal protein S13|tara:strand:+ start:73 stop:369 length:297 start_codon:yes stop_codon:yes gene_type:complete